MKKNRVVLCVLAFALTVNPVFASPFWQAPSRAQENKPESKPENKTEITSAPRPIEVADIMKWKRIGSPTPSADGQYFASKLIPVEGDGEVVVRRIKDGKEWRFPTGESAGGGGGFGAVAARDIAFSEDGKWFAYTVSPTFRESKRLRRERRPLQNKVVLVNLETEKKTEFEKVKRFTFSGERGTWLALHRYGAEGPGQGGPAGSGAAPTGGTGAAPSATPAVERPTGSDLILQELATGNQLNLGNVSEFSFDEKGDWLVWIVDAQDKIGNGLQLRNMTTGVVTPLDSDKASYKGLTWTEKNDGLTSLKGVEDKAWEDKLYSLVAFTGFSTSTPQKTVYDPREDKSFPAGMTISPNRNPTWTEDLSAVFFGVQELKKKKTPPMGERREGEAAPPTMAMRRPDDEPEKAALVLWHWQDKRLQAQQQVEEGRDKNFSYLSIYRVAEKKFIRLADESLRQVNASPRSQWAVGYDDREYELLGNLDGRDYKDIYVVDLKTGARKLAVKKNRWAYGASPDGTQFLYYDDGQFFAYDLATGQSSNITAKVPATFYNTEDDHNVVKPPRFPLGWTKESKSVLISDGWDIWNIPVRGGQAVNLTVNGKKDGLRYRTRYALDPKERGVDLNAPIYLGVYGEWTKKAGIGRIEGGKTGAKMLSWDDAAYGGLTKAKKADVYFYTRETYKDYPDYQVADAMLANSKQLTTANPQQKDFLWSAGSKLIDYTSAKGDKLQASLFLPANYQPGRSYPTVVYIYEKLSQGTNSYTAPTANGFNKSVYTSQGYAVLMPDITYKVNDPGMSAVWCILPALEAAIKTGVVDRANVAIHGHSWGGYQTAFLVTQTDAFKAAIAGAPLTDMISMYNLIYWNSGGGNMAIFESSQGRFTGSPVDNIEAYIRNSPIYHAKNVKTPLMILHNDKDGAVDFTQGIEYFNTLRRMQKPVVMLQYKGENHGLAVPANRKDYTVRMKEYLDHNLMGKPAPKWLQEGVPHLKLGEHLEERAKEKTDPVAPLGEEPLQEQER